MLTTHNIFLNITDQLALQSPDPSTKVGCVVVKNSNIVASGYNSFSVDANHILERFTKPLKYHLILHAEEVALLNLRTSNLKSATLYVSEAPCEHCLKLILQKGIKTIIFRNHTLCRKFTDIQKIALELLISSSGCTIISETGRSYSDILKD